MFLAGGISTLNLVRKLPFVWTYCFFSAVILSLSLFVNRDELVATVKNLEIKMYWKPENTLNAYLLSGVALLGLIMTLIMGTPSIICIGIFLFLMVAVWMFSVVAYKKYNIRIQSIFMVCSGLMVFMACCVAFTFMAQRKKNKK